MKVVWKSIATSSIFDGINQEKGTYIMVKKDFPLTKEDNKTFEGRIGLALHEYIDAMIVLGQMRFPEVPMYEALCKLCEEHLIPFIWGGMEGAQAATVKGIFRPHGTELHRLFDKYNSHKVMTKLDWTMLCGDIFESVAKTKFQKGGQPTLADVHSAYELAKEGHDLDLTYKLFENALQQLAHKLYKKAPKQKYSSPKYPDKLKMLLKWATKLEKSGAQKTAKSGGSLMKRSSMKRIKSKASTSPSKSRPSSPRTPRTPRTPQ